MPQTAPSLSERAIHVTRHESALGTWELARAHSASVLRPLVREYVGWRERLTVPLLRRELPTDEAPLIINFGAPFTLLAPGSSGDEIRLASFVTGAYDTYQLVESSGETSGVQINFSLLGLRAFVGRPIEDMTNRALAPEDVFGRFARELAGRLADAGSWDARFAYLDRVLLHSTQNVAMVPGGVRHAWQRLLASSGRASIASIREETGWSERHFISQFRHELGVTPKVLARMLRFGRFAGAIRRGEIAGLADGADRFGYFDQSHLSRDARDFAGTTPGELLRSLLPGGGGFGA